MCSVWMCVLGTFSGFRKHFKTKHTGNIDQQIYNDITSSTSDLCETEELVTENVEKTPTISAPLSNRYVCYCCRTTQSSWIKSV